MIWFYLVATLFVLEYLVEKAIIAWRNVNRADKEMREWREKHGSTNADAS